MVQRRLDDKAALVLEHLLDVLVRRLDVLADEVRNLLREAAGVVDGARRHLVRADDAVLHCDTVIVLTEGRCLMDDTSTVLGRDVGVADDAEGAVLVLGAQ